MPEMALMCGDEEHSCASVTARMYRKYTEIMERNIGESAQKAFRMGMEILKEVFGISAGQVQKADVVELLAAVKTVHFTMQEVITPKFLELNPEHPEQQEKSAFDDYDEENGYNEEEEPGSIWKVCRENLDRVVKLCIRAFHDSYTQCMGSDIMSLLDYVAFEILTIKEK